MLLTCNRFQRRYKGLRFESSWLLRDDFKQTVRQSWTALMRTNNRARTLHIMLARLAKSLKRWHKLHNTQLQKDSNDAQQLVLQLD
jgi:hypothetical protein